MKTAKRLLALFLSLLVLISIFTVGASAAGSNIRIEAPRPGNYPDMYPTVNSSTIYILGVDWYESGEYENGYHRMYSGEEFEKGNSYRVVITFDMHPLTNESPLTHPITINGNQPSYRYGFQVAYDFGECRGGFFATVWDIITFPFAAIIGFFAAIFG